MRRAVITILEAGTIVTIFATYVANVRRELAVYIVVPLITLVVSILFLHGDKYARFLERKALTIESVYGVHVYGRERASMLIVFIFMFVSILALVLVYLQLVPAIVFPISLVTSVLLAMLIIPMAITRAKVLSSMIDKEVPIAIAMLKLFSDASIPLPTAIELLESRLMSGLSTIVRVCRRFAQVSFHRIEDVFLGRIAIYSKKMYEYVSVIHTEYVEHGVYRTSIDSFYRLTMIDMENILRNVYAIVRGLSELIPESIAIIATIIGSMYIFYPGSYGEILFYLVVIPGIIATVASIIVYLAMPPLARIRIGSPTEKVVLVATGCMIPIALTYLLFIEGIKPNAVALSIAMIGLPSVIILPRILSLMSGSHIRLVRLALREVVDMVTMGKNVDESIKKLKMVLNESLAMDVFVDENVEKIVRYGLNPSNGLVTLFELYDIVSARMLAIWRCGIHGVMYSIVGIGTVVLTYILGAFVHTVLGRYASYMMGLLVSMTFFEGMKFVIASLPIVFYFVMATILGYLYALPFLSFYGFTSYLIIHALPTMTEWFASLLLGGT